MENNETTALNQSPATLHESPLNGLFGYAFTIPGGNPTELGAPKLLWGVKAFNGAPGWQLTVKGLVDRFDRQVIVGSVAEDDVEGLAEITKLMLDREALFAYVSFTNADAVKKIVGELRTRELVRSTVGKPVISIRKVRDVLVQAGLAPSAEAPSNKTNVGHINSLYVRMGSEKVAVAAAITAPEQLYKSRGPGTLHSKEGRAAWVTDTEGWRDDAAKALKAAGYRIVDLPQPVTAYGKPIPVFWITLYNEVQWEEARPAAELPAIKLKSYNGPLITPAADKKR